MRTSRGPSLMTLGFLLPAKAFCQSGSTAGASGTNVEITVVGDRAAEPQVEPWLAVEPVFPDSLRVTMHGRRPAPWVFTRPPGWLDFLPEMYWSINGGDSTGVGAWTLPPRSRASSAP